MLDFLNNPPSPAPHILLCCAMNVGKYFKGLIFWGNRTVLECGLLPLSMPALVNLKKYYSSPKVANKKHSGNSTVTCLNIFLAKLGKTKCLFGLHNGEIVSCKIPASFSFM